MVQTITIGSCVSVQGLVMGTDRDGKIRIQVGDRIYTGKPVIS